MAVRNGPRTVSSGNVRIGLMQIRVGNSADNIDAKEPALTSTDSIGALARTKYTGNVDWWDLETGYPLLIDAKFPIRESAGLEGDMMELTPQNLAYVHGYDASTGYTELFSGEVKLGVRAAPAYLRTEAIGVYPDGVKSMIFIFPRAQITASVELEDQKEEGASLPIMITATPADSGIASGGSATWDTMPLGRILITETDYTA